MISANILQLNFHLVLLKLHDFDLQDKVFWPEDKMLQMRVPAVLVCQHFCSVAVVADNSGCCCWMLIDVEPALIHFLRRHHFPFLYKNNIVPSMVLTAHEIPLTVFLPSPAYFYSFGYFILGICWACFGRGKIYCFISGCTFISSRHRRTWFWALFCCQLYLHRTVVYPTPQCRARPQGGFSARKEWLEGANDTCSFWRKYWGPGQKSLFVPSSGIMQCLQTRHLKWFAFFFFFLQEMPMRATDFHWIPWINNASE